MLCAPEKYRSQRLRSDRPLSSRSTARASSGPAGRTRTVEPSRSTTSASRCAGEPAITITPHRTGSVAGAGGVDVAGLEQPEGALGDVGELVGDDRVQPRLVKAELDEAALGRLQVEHLRTALPEPWLQEVLPLLVGGVEDGPDDVEGAVLRRSRVQHPDPHPLVRLDPDRPELVLR